MTTTNSRTSDHPIDRLFLDRWSPRALTGEAMPQADLDTILEAARWAPSSSNVQPWRFVYAHRDTPAWDRLFGLLVPFNQSWVAKAAVLIVVVSQANVKQADGQDRPSYTHSFDAGAAWASLAFQALMSGWDAHGMAGFDHKSAYGALGVPEDGWRVEAAVAIGRRGEASTLPEALAAREKPSDRLPLGAIAFEGSFQAG